MKGQYRIVGELILFGIGIMITSYVIINFNTVRDNVRNVTLADQMESVADAVSIAIVKASNTENSTFRLDIPDKLSERSYRISIKDADGGRIIVGTIDGTTKVERQIFNINYDNIQQLNNIINNSEVVSTVRLIEIVKNDKITIRRVPISGTTI